MRGRLLLIACLLPVVLWGCGAQSGAARESAAALDGKTILS